MQKRSSVIIFIVSSMIMVSCKSEGNRRTAVQTTNAEIPVSPQGTQTRPVVSNEITEEQKFMEACLEGAVAEVEIFIKTGLDLNGKDEDGRNGLMLASFNGHTKIVKMLLDNKAEINTTDLMGRTALMYASTGHFPETVKMLLLNGAEVNLTDSVEGFTALMFAGAEGNSKVVRLLLEHGANPNIKDKDEDTAESFARKNGHIEVADILRKAMGG